MVGADGRSEGALRADLEEIAGQLRGRWLARATKRACVIVAGGSQRERGGSDEQEPGVDEGDVLVTTRLSPDLYAAGTLTLRPMGFPAVAVAGRLAHQC